MVLGEVFRPKPGPQEAPRGPKTAKTKNCKIQEIRFSGCQWDAQLDPSRRQSIDHLARCPVLGTDTFPAQGSLNFH